MAHKRMRDFTAREARIASELEVLRTYPDSAFEDRISLVVDLVSQLSRRGGGVCPPIPAL